MSRLPTGTVTFLFTDIEGSTARWDRHPDAMRGALARHDDLMRAAVESNGGHVFKTVGDAFCAVFATAAAGLAAAIDAQRAVTAENWSVFGAGFAPLAVRMGLHTGEATERGGDYFGQPVNRVARIEAAAHGGQVLVSDATYNLVREQLPEGCGLRDLGEHRLKDLRHTEHIFQVVGPGMPEIEAVPTSAEVLHPRERVVVREAEPGEREAEARRAEGLWASLEAAILGEDGAGATLTLTTAEAAAMARHAPATWREWRLGRVAEWSQPRYRLDGRFVGLTLLVDQGEASEQGRWRARDERFEGLGALLASVPDPALVVLGAPGSGKSTLLRHLELDLAIEGLRAEGRRPRAHAPDAAGSGGQVPGPAASRVTFFVPLSTYAPPRPGAPMPDPGEWLAALWAARYPALPTLDALLAEGRMTFLLDALNEMPAASEHDLRAHVQLWKGWLHQLVAMRPGNRVVFSCRSLDYSQPLSTPELRVPQIRIEPLSDAQVRDFVRLHSPGRRREIWKALEGSPQLEVVRSPYFLALLVEQVEATGELPAGRAALFTGFVRQALRREVERGSALFAPGDLLQGRDVRRITGWQWQGAYDLPERGMLVPKLAALADGMQRAAGGGASQVRIDVDEALDLLDSDADEAIMAAGSALAVLDEDQAAGAVMYAHQLVQEYFAARVLARAPDPALVRTPWRADEVRPGVREVLAGLDPADTLPPLPATGWEETTVLAAVMAEDPNAFLRGLMDANLSLAGRAAAEPELRGRLDACLVGALREALARRAGDAAADLRDRIACGFAVGELGDPRLERGVGPDGAAFLSPPWVDIAGGVYPMGDDEALYLPDQDAWDRSHMPRHAVALGGFAMARYPVTNAEWACFMAAGGYDDERWWDTAAGRAWRAGEGTADGPRWNNRFWWQRFRERPELLRQMIDEARMLPEAAERWQRWVGLDEAAFETELRAMFPGGRHTEPLYWQEPRFNRPNQPVVGICWYEMRAYAVWLSEQSGRRVRLPSEAEWEAAARGAAGRAYACGDVLDPAACNVATTRLKRAAPVGVFVEGATPEGVCDLTGGVNEWTVSAFTNWVEDSEGLNPRFGYPYAATDGREDPDTGTDISRVVRGGSWSLAPALVRAAARYDYQPAYRARDLGGRLVVVRGA